MGRAPGNCAERSAKLCWDKVPYISSKRLGGRSGTCGGLGGSDSEKGYSGAVSAARELCEDKGDSDWDEADGAMTALVFITRLFLLVRLVGKYLSGGPVSLPERVVGIVKAV